MSSEIGALEVDKVIRNTCEGLYFLVNLHSKDLKLCQNLNFFAGTFHGFWENCNLILFTFAKLKITVSKEQISVTFSANEDLFIQDIYFN